MKKWLIIVLIIVIFIVLSSLIVPKVSVKSYKIWGFSYSEQCKCLGFTWKTSNHEDPVKAYCIGHLGTCDIDTLNDLYENGTLKFGKYRWFCVQNNCIRLANFSMGNHDQEITDLAKNNTQVNLRGIVQNTKVDECDFSEMQCEKYLELIVSNYKIMNQS